LATFENEEVARLTGHPPEQVGKILSTISLLPGALSDANPEHLFLSNPIWTAPGIQIEEKFFVPMPQVAFSHIHELIRGLSEKAGLRDDLERIRARYLEVKLEETLNKALPGASVATGVSWNLDGQRFETDALVILDRTVIIAEAKSHHLTPEGLRGAPARVKRHIQDLVLSPSLQSERLEKLIEAARSGDELAVETVSKIGLHPSKIDRVIRLSVTLEDLSVLSSAEADLKEVQWVPADHRLAPNIHIADLLCIVDILDNSLLLLHYLSERSFFQKSFTLLGDELDFLGLYLETGLNLADLERHDGQFSPTGMSEPIDRYYIGRDAGLKLPKPKMKLRPLFRNILERLNQTRPQGWTTVGLHLLSSADPSEQRKVENGLNKLREMVRKQYREPEHLNALHIKPPHDRKARVIFYLFPEALRASFPEAMRLHVEQAFADEDCEECVVFARCTENWGRPYELVCSARR